VPPRIDNDIAHHDTVRGDTVHHDTVPIDIVHKDAHLLVVDKPPGIPTTSPGEGDCLVRRVRKADPEAPALHPVSRLDAQVSGLVTFSRTREANRHLRDARASGAYRRLYLGLAAAPPSPPRGCWQTPIGIDPRDPRRRVGGPKGKGGPPAKAVRQAATDYRTAHILDQVALLLLWPRTGRTHQLRIHCSLAGSPLLGDRHYGGPVRVVRPDGRVIRARRIMLHCTRLVLPDPTGSGELVIEALPSADMTALWRALGGGDSLPLPDPATP
jgi:23S rRNA-/tRNA-specific pseudouridylate synthase